jgi:hypothetical protein
MNEENDSSNEYGIIESAETDISEIAEVMEEPKIDETIYGKNKPRRVTINRKVIYDDKSK